MLAWQRTSRLLQLRPTLVVNSFKSRAFSITRPFANQQIDEWRNQHEITVEGEDVPDPILNFNDADFLGSVKPILQKTYDTPTPIQSQVWPMLQKKKSVIAISATGSGKTLGFTLPALPMIYEEKQAEGTRLRARISRKASPSMLCIVPTRELAQQINEAIRPYLLNYGLTAVSVYGGAARDNQFFMLRKGCDILVATPGRLYDFLNSNTISLENLKYLVFDEADRMLDMGFEPQIREIMNFVTSEPQIAFFTATWPKEVQHLAKSIAPKALKVLVGSQDLKVNKNIEQQVVCIPQAERLDRLVSDIRRLQEEGHSRFLVFAGTKSNTDFLTFQLNSRGFAAVSIHGDKSQSQRDNVMKAYKQGRVKILIATDVAARGLDVKDINVVINYSMPMQVVDYVHRIGRTGRGGAIGLAISYFSDGDAKLASGIVKFMRQADQEPPEDLIELSQFIDAKKPSRGNNHRGGRFGRINMSERPFQMSHKGQFNSSRFQRSNSARYGRRDSYSEDDRSQRRGSFYEE